MAPKAAVKKIQIVIETLEAIKEKLKHLWLAIIAGGAGERLFCKSHAARSKPFVRCPDSQLNFLGDTIKRYIELGVMAEHIVIIVCDDVQQHNAEKELETFGKLTGITIPTFVIVNIGTKGHNYAGAQLDAARIIINKDPEAVIIGTPADH